MITLDIQATVPTDLAGPFHEALQKKFELLANQLYDKVIENVSGKILKIKTGELASSIRKEVDLSGPTMIVLVGPESESPKALALEKGGEADYMIVPSKARALAFFWEKIGEHVVFDYVNHPPSKAFHYLRDALEQMEGVAAEEMSVAVREVGGE